MSRWLVDNSVLQRLPRAPSVRDAVLQVVDAGGVLCSSTPSILEAGFSVRSEAEHAVLVNQLTTSFEVLPLTSQVGELAVDIQKRLWSAGRGRAAGAFDVLQAAVAIHHGAAVMHYDHDFEQIAAVDDRLRQAWVVPRGSVN